MKIASIVVVAILFWSLWFFLSLPFGNVREPAGEQSFGGIRQPYLWRKVVFATVMGVLSTLVFFLFNWAG